MNGRDQIKVQVALIRRGYLKILLPKRVRAMGWQIGGRSNYAIGGPRGALMWHPFPAKRARDIIQNVARSGKPIRMTSPYAVDTC